MANRSGISLALVAVVVLSASALGFNVYLTRISTFDPAPLVTYYEALRMRPAHPVDPARVRVGIDAAADYLRRANLPSGQFVYLAHMDSTVRVPSEYSLLRHAGTIYSLGMAYSVTPNPDTMLVMQRAVRFMRECCFEALDGGEMAGIGEPPEIVKIPGPLDYKLGGAGLGLVALISLESIAAGSVSRDEMRDLARFGQFMQRRSGEFYAKFTPSEGGRKLPGGSLYYPGEMALAWLMLHERQSSPDLVESAVRALDFLATERARAGAAPADHWALLATSKLLEIAERDGMMDIPREKIFNHALQVCHAILEEGYASPILPEMDGALVAKGLVTPTATRLEGLMAALTFMPLDHPMRSHVESAVHRGVDFLLRAQVKDGPFAGAMPYAIAKVPNARSAEAYAFNAKVGEVRIDYVQHSLSALVQYLEWVQAAKP